MTIVGGIYAVSEEAQYDLEAVVPSVERVHAGITGGRYDTMLQICRKYDSVFTNKDTVCVATGMAFPDALAGAALAAKNGCPLVLVGYSDSAKKVSSINEQLQAYITSKSISKTFVFGGIYAVADNQIERLIKKVTPISVKVSLALDGTNVTYSAINGATGSGKSYVWNGTSDVSFKVTPTAGYEVVSVKYDTGYKAGEIAVDANGICTISKDVLKSSYDTTFTITAEVKAESVVKIKFEDQNVQFEEINGVTDNGTNQVWNKNGDITFKVSAADGYKITGVNIDNGTESSALEPNAEGIYTLSAQELQSYEAAVITVSAQTEKLPVVSVNFAADNATVSDISGAEQNDSEYIWDMSSDVSFEVSASDGYEVSRVLIGTGIESEEITPDENGVYIVSSEMLESDADISFVITVETSKLPVVTVVFEGENVSFSDVSGADETESGYVWDKESDVVFAVMPEDGYAVSDVKLQTETEPIALMPDENGVYTISSELLESDEDATVTVTAETLLAV